jgi:hypothetical protein
MPCAAEDGRRTLEWLQVSTRSPLGAIALHTGGLLVDHGWLRVLGGSFAWFREPRTIHDFAPDTLRWEDLELECADWLATMLGDGLGAFYASLRWDGWQAEVRALAGDRALLVWPPLVADGPPLAERAHRPVPMTEAWALHQQLAENLAALPDGAPFEVQVTQG